MNLMMIRKNLRKGIIRTESDFKRDVMMVFQNAIIYYKPKEVTYLRAKEMGEYALRTLEVCC